MGLDVFIEWDGKNIGVLMNKGEFEMLFGNCFWFV